MKIKKKTRKFFAALGAILLIFSLELTTGGAAKAVSAENKEAAYSSVIADLSKDKAFKIEDYPVNTKDTQIHIIQIAESDRKELFLYLYIPASTAYNMEITTARFSTSYEGGTWLDYNIERVSSSNVLHKYLVKDFEVSDKSTRFYNIAAIQRKWDKILDGGTVTENNSTEIACEVAQCWTVTAMNGKTLYSMEEAETITITGFMGGSVRYSDGHGWVDSYAIDSHFIAFNTDRRIDALLEADVTYEYAVKKDSVWTTKEGEWQKGFVTVNYKEVGATTGEHTFNSKKRTWDKIETTDDFIKTATQLSDDSKKELRKYKWVVHFLQTEYKDYTGGVFGFVNWFGSLFGANNTSSCTVVRNASILRLKFVTDGEVYNLGVVSNKSGDFELGGDDITSFWQDVWNGIKGFFDSVKNDIKSIPWWVWLIVAVVAVAIGLPLLCYFVPAVAKVVLIVLKAIGKGLLWLLKGLWWLVSYPFKKIHEAIQNRRDRGGSEK